MVATLEEMVDRLVDYWHGLTDKQRYDLAHIDFLIRDLAARRCQ